MDSTIALVVFTDGRGEFLKETIQSLSEKIGLDSFADRWIIDDSGNKTYEKWLNESFPEFRFDHHVKNMGFCHTVDKAWRDLKENSNADFVFHIEDDFTYNETVDLQNMAKILTENHHLGQLALKRQPVNNEEKRAGDLVRRWGFENFEEKDGWIEHSIFWTTNPSLFRREILDYGWLTEPQCEGKVSIKLRNMGFKFAFLGGLQDPPKIHHIGSYRAGKGY